MNKFSIYQVIGTYTSTAGNANDEITVYPESRVTMIWLLKKIKGHLLWCLVGYEKLQINEIFIYNSIILVNM